MGGKAHAIQEIRYCFDLTCLQRVGRSFNTTMILHTLSAQLRTRDGVPAQKWFFGHMTNAHIATL